MKKFILNILLFSLPVVLAIVACEFALRSIPNDYSYKRERLDDAADTVKVLIMGSSHAYSGIDPNTFSLPVFNTAHSGQTIDLDRFIFDKYIDQMDSLELIVLSLSHFSMHADYGILDGFKFKNYVVHYGWGNPFSFYYNVRLAHLRYQDMDKYWNYISNGINEVECNELGGRPKYAHDKITKSLEATAELSAKRHDRRPLDNSIYCANMQHLTHIIDECFKRGVEVALVITPTHHSYRQLVENEQSKMLFAAVDSLTDKYPDIHLFNNYADTSYHDCDFRDADHINYNASLRFTQMLVDSLSNI